MNSIHEGNRNNALFELGVQQATRGMAITDLMGFLCEENEKRCMPPLSTDEVARIAVSAYRGAAMQP